ncbi:MAG: hypothetical protein QXN55_01515 [Candidatus Nitrosotenuis sp.]
MITFKQFLADDFETHIEYHSSLNTDLWEGEQLKPVVATALKKIADEFVEFLGISKTAVSDIIITGSNCNFNYAIGFSDIDLHIVINVDEPDFCPSCGGDFIQDCFWAKKQLWNMEHNITIKGYPVELYAQPDNDELIAAGVYSLTTDSWLKKPSIERPTYDNIGVKAKAEELKKQIDELLDNCADDYSAVKQIKVKLKQLRQAGLSNGGEFSIENLAWKALRNNGYLAKLSNIELHLHDKSLSI